MIFVEIYTKEKEGSFHINGEGGKATMNTVPTHAPYGVVVAFNEIIDGGGPLYFTDEEIETARERTTRYRRCAR